MYDLHDTMIISVVGDCMKVYHKKNFRELVEHPRDNEGWLKMMDAQEQAQFPRDYTLVATVEGDDVEKAFELTNTIDHSWWENEGATALFDDSGCRSTSVGDVVVMSDGRQLECAPFGWKLLNDELYDD
jgi:hypothetical protein